ncbi:unnamed protein product [Rangifer tarandus platyrhynchus]|uniref:Uncharacterized protein n=1 Tax=Rangifer tarandus platyrhynchus TaxID=3082113 RepID=A0ABN8XN58_RANTA|nr:unnamed protein product [Rangifer tarandus platyrhynchus]
MLRADVPWAARQRIRRRTWATSKELHFCNDRQVHVALYVVTTMIIWFSEQLNTEPGVRRHAPRCERTKAQRCSTHDWRSGRSKKLQIIAAMVVLMSFHRRDLRSRPWGNSGYTLLVHMLEYVDVSHLCTF